MSARLVKFENRPHAVFREVDDWGVRALDLASLPRRLLGNQPSVSAPVRTNIDPCQTEVYPLPGELLYGPLGESDTWSAITKRSLARFAAFFLVCEDPQRRLDAREVLTLAHQVSLVRHILDSPNCRRVLIADEVGLGKTVVAGLILEELLAANSSLRILYLAPARLVSNVGREFRRLSLSFREWKSQDGDARLETDSRVIASIHRAVHHNHFERLCNVRPWDVIVVDECHHLTDWAEGGGDPIRKYRLVRDLVAAQPPEGRLLLMSGTPHQAHAARFENLLKLLVRSGESSEAVAGRVIYRTKEDVRDWDGNPLFPLRQVNPPIVIDLELDHRAWLTAIHQFFRPPPTADTQARRRAAGWKCAQALQWATSSPNAGLGYLVRQALRSGWSLDDPPLSEAIAALRPYRAGPPDEPVLKVFERLMTEIRRQTSDDDIEDIEEDGDWEDEIDRMELAKLMRRGIELVLSPIQVKWEQLYSEVLEGAGAEKIVLFAQPIETVMALATWLEKRDGQRPAIIIGGQSDADRDREVARFRDPSGPQFLVSSRAGGEGINLQFSRRLVHLDVPWNPMEMEQRVGRVHRFGSRETVLVDTLVVRDSRESRAWHVARQRLQFVAETLVAKDRFETVFARVMCLIPPEELQSVLIGSSDSISSDIDIQKLSSLVDSGFRNWRDFHEKYAENQRTIREQPAGLARWGHVQDFLLNYGDAEIATGIRRTRFVQREGTVQAVNEPAEILKLRDGSLRFVGDYDGVQFDKQSSSSVEPLGLNVPAVADLLHRCANPVLPCGAGFLRWGVDEAGIRERLGEEVVILAFVRQTFRLDSVGGINEVGTELMTYALHSKKSWLLSDEDRAALITLNRSAKVRVRPYDSPLLQRAQSEEKRLFDELRRPAEDAIRRGERYAVWPVLALYLSA